jgi:hypothetical protein
MTDSVGLSEISVVLLAPVSGIHMAGGFIPDKICWGGAEGPGDGVGWGGKCWSVVTYINAKFCQVVVAHAFNPSTWEAEAGGFLSSRPVWSTK